jgi:hypothetical protein
MLDGPETDAGTLSAEPMMPETSSAQPLSQSTPSASLTPEPTLLSVSALKDTLDPTATNPTTSAKQSRAPIQILNAETEDAFARPEPHPLVSPTAEKDQLIQINALADLLTKDLASTTTSALETLFALTPRTDQHVSAHLLLLDLNAARLNAEKTQIAREITHSA